MFYRAIIVAYSLYFIFSSQAFAMQAEAPAKEQPSQNILNVEKVEYDDRADKIRRYYERYDLPLAEHAEDFVYYADKYEIDWTLVASIGFIESTGGKFACKTVGYNAWGWGSCSIGFDSYEQAIDHITWILSGTNPKMAHYYAGKDIRGILETYNPPEIVPDYADKVMREMKIMKSM